MSSGFWLSIYCALLALLLTPFALVTHPPLQDYPNHLARIFVLLHPNDPVLARFYQFEWRLVPNLGMELGLAFLTRWWPLATAGKVFVAGSAVAMTSAAVALHWQIYRRLSVAPLLGLLFVYAAPMQKGFLSFLWASALALWAFVCWRAIARWHPALRLAATAVMATVLWPVHLFGVGLFGVLVTCTTAGEVWRTHRRFAPVVSALATQAAAFVPSALLLLLRSGGDAGASLGAMEFRFPPAKLVVLHRLFDGYSIAWDVTVAIGLLWLLARMWRAGGFVPPDMEAPLLGLVAVYLIMPSAMFQGTNTDYRLLMPMAMFAAAVVRDPCRDRRQQLRAAAAIVLIVAAKAAVVASAWQQAEQVYQDFHQIVAEVPEGSRLAAFTIDDSYAGATFPVSVLHIGGFAVVERKAFVPTLFANPLDHTLSYAPGYEALTAHLRSGAFARPEDVPWTTLDAEYDYLVMIRTAGSEDPRTLTADRTASRAVRELGWFVLYKTPRGASRERASSHQAKIKIAQS